jgi:hypothetical protein
VLFAFYLSVACVISNIGGSRRVLLRPWLRWMTSSAMLHLLATVMLFTLLAGALSYAEIWYAVLADH